jgi:hypothetical protein
VQLGRAQLDTGDPAAAETLERAADGARLAGDRRLLAMAQVAQAEALAAAGDRPAARLLMEAADDWYRESGGGEGAVLATGLLAALRADDGKPAQTSDVSRTPRLRQ